MPARLIYWFYIIITMSSLKPILCEQSDEQYKQNKMNVYIEIILLSI